jgi:nanoRNase/pAp phosphatase (c-di-AMP/oligoRNAs hydrolase)
LVSRYGGGGHLRAGTTPIGSEHTDEILAEIVDELKTNG